MPSEKPLVRRLADGHSGAVALDQVLGFDHRAMSNGTAKSQSGTLVSVTGGMTRYVSRGPPSSSNLRQRLSSSIPLSAAQLLKDSDASCHRTGVPPAGPSATNASLCAGSVRKVSSG